MEWQSLVGTALVGTERQTPTLSRTDGELTSLLNQLDWSQPEQALLGAAGAIALYRQVGQRPTPQELPLFEPCPLDDRPHCSARTAQLLDRAFTEYPAVLPELLTLIAAAGERVPELGLPKLLHFGRQNIRLRPQIVAVLGKRGQWLAAQNSAWAYGRGQVTLGSPKQVWQQGNLMERSLYLRRWREVEPDEARQALEAAWTSELAEAREGLMLALVHHLSMADEPFLENALDDRAQGVRKLAVELLVQLPESRLCQRMAQRVQTYVQLHPDGEDWRLEVTLPKSAEKDWARDGINVEFFKGAGKRALGLQQLLASTSLGVWPEPAATVRAATNSEWRDVLVEGWGRAAVQQKHRDWADALVSQFGDQGAEQFADLLANLLALLEPERREQLLRATLPPQAEEQALLAWLHQAAQNRQAFSLGFSRLVWEQLLHLLKMKEKSYILGDSLKKTALILHPDLLPEVAPAIAPPRADRSTYLQTALDKLHDCLRFRLEIRQAFADRQQNDCHFDCSSTP
ncbi:MAG: DUF5691 domain-containing protein [Cyanophyceae cyanobacterium]